MKIKINSTIRRAFKTFSLSAGAVAALLTATSARAEIYFVNRSFTDGSTTATLIGTVDVPLGSYTIQNMGASPFTSVNLTLTVNATAFAVDNVLTGIIQGTGQFNINATATTLTFGTANSDGGNPADLEFSDTTDPHANDRYVLGSNGDPRFEAGYTSAGSVLSTAVSFPTVFATVAPEPTTLALAGLGGMALMLLRRRRK
jgi:hypothetical protein